MLEPKRANPGDISMQEIQERCKMRLLGSQRAFLEAPEMFKVASGGWCSGKTLSSCLHGVMLSALFPGNEGVIGRYKGTDLEMSTKPAFFEVCPPSWIAKHGYNKQANTVRLKNGSIIYFRHIHDASAKSPTKTRIVGANLGWFLLDQMEEMEETHLLSMMGRLRNPKARVRMGLGTANPNGRDWIQQKFFPDASPLKPGELFRVQRRGNLFGVLINSEENRVSKGGFVDDTYFDSLLDNMTPEFVARYVHGSLADFTGKIYKGYTMDSVHNIEPFPIPSNWECVTGIDVGGDCPWAVVPNYVDEYGNLIVTDGFHKATGLVQEPANWIKTNTPWSEPRTTFVIDPENRVAMVELAEHGVHCRIAQKAVLAGILRVSGYFHVNKKVGLPPWYYETQPATAVEKFRGQGAPRIYIFKSALVTRKEHDTYVWDESQKNVPKKTTTQRFDSVDSERYVVATRPEASKLPRVEDKYVVMRQQDPLSARHWEAFDKRVLARQQLASGVGSCREASVDAVEVGFETVVGTQKGYDWGEGA